MDIYDDELNVTKKCLRCIQIYHASCFNDNDDSGNLQKMLNYPQGI